MPAPVPLIKMLYPELVEFINSLDGNEPESSTLDLKRQLPPDAPKVTRLIAAMANGGGGAIIYGAEEDKQAGNVIITPVKLEGIAAKFSEWIGSIVRSNIDPSPRVEVATITNPEDTTVALLVVQVAESLAKPVQTKDGKFPIRIGTTTADASRAQVIDMLYASRSRVERLEAKLKARHIADPNAEDFCLNNNARKLHPIPARGEYATNPQNQKWLATMPVVCFAVTPLEEVNLPRFTKSSLDDLHRFTGPAIMWELMPNHKFTIGQTARTTASGLLGLPRQENEARSLVEFHRDGHVEVVSNQTFFVAQEQGQSLAAIYLSGLSGYFMTLAKFHSNFLAERANYEGQLILSIAVRSAASTQLYGLGKEDRFSMYRGRPTPFADDNFLFTHTCTKEQLDDDASASQLITDVVEDIAAVYGLQNATGWYTDFPQGLCIHARHHGMPFE